jgi:DNA-binding response OmpR family regulator
MAGHTVIEAADGREAVGFFADGGDRPATDLVVVDGMMPNLGGASTLRAIREISPGIPVLVVSAVSDLEVLPEWQGADDYFIKPIDFERLLGRIAELTSGRSS